MSETPRNPSADPLSQQPQPGVAPAGTDFPGKTLGIVGLVLSFFTAIVGFILCLIALQQSRKAGYKNTPALVGVVIGIITTVIVIISIIAAVLVTAPSGTH